MNNELKNEVQDEIQTFVEIGFYNKDQIAEQIETMFYEEELDEEWVESQIDEFFSKKLKDQQNWPFQTDFDKLAIVFDNLNQTGIIALHNAGYTRQDGEGDCEFVHEKLKQEGIPVKGYCFYHMQDIEKAMNETIADLYLAFGDFESDDTKGIQVGQTIVKFLQAKGFEVEWDNTMDTRILITRFYWQKRFDNVDWYERTIENLRQSKG
jgi:hypothetical protein